MTLVDAPIVAIVPSWNGRSLIEPALATLSAQRDVDLEVLVVDNGSTDTTVDHLREHWPDVAVLELPRNVGFAAAVNRGIEASCGEFVALVNNDVELEPDWASTLAAALRRDRNLGSATGKIMDKARPGVFDSAGDIVGWDGYCAPRGRGRPDSGQYDRPGRVFSACGGASLYRRSVMLQVGGFDERFFAYMEDVDWGFRAQLAGFDCAYEPTAIAHHSAGSTSGRIAGFELYHAHRNLILMMAKNFPATALVLHAGPAAARRLLSLVKASRSGQGRVVLRAWRAAFRMLPHALAARKDVQATRTREWAELRRLIPARAPFKGRL